MSPATQTPESESKLTSKFQRAMVQSDFESSVLRRLTEVDTSGHVILLDLVDERTGVVPTSTGYVTNSYELRNSGWKRVVAAGDVLEFGTPAHLTAWKGAAASFKDFLIRHNLMRNVLLIKTAYADRSIQGDILAERMRRSPSEWNGLYEPYYVEARRLGFAFIEADVDVVFADRDHTWGLEAFHYQDAYYRDIADKISNFAMGL